MQILRKRLLLRPPPPRKPQMHRSRKIQRKTGKLINSKKTSPANRILLPQTRAHNSPKEKANDALYHNKHRNPSDDQRILHTHKHVLHRLHPDMRRTHKTLHAPDQYLVTPRIMHLHMLNVSPVNSLVDTDKQIMPISLSSLHLILFKPLDPLLNLRTSTGHITRLR